MVKHKVVKGINIPPEQLQTKLRCDSRTSAKPKRMSFGDARDKRTTVNVQRMTSDVCDMRKYVQGVGAVRYLQLIHDECSRYKWCFPLKRQSEAAGNTQKLMAELLDQNKRIVKFTCDGGGEYVNNELKTFLEKPGIALITTHPYTPEENCLVEKHNGVLVDKMRATMHDANLSMVLWPEVLQYVVKWTI
ncbi:hypothetical protein PC129_g12782 [Phytophthora cactorum]|nr:hypothetical protein PC112_g14457 [Phytophthora cactorum]KAG2815814.1 hypothetical protein PC111_g13410 [Phytophthora cactorum]KAG2852857.1 hypothetical protein PC113_g14666 [Phytophthora cactorum]KAG2894771.1 hypothetical protein PC114_g15768 [Phytophthora cactorum]KAG2974407.1 hypothetical protein PC118_g14529 [Phytophthora cactorum]